MPGLVGIITRGDSEATKLQLRRMIAAMCHESFYESGEWCDESAGVYLGWIRRQGTSPAGQPIQDESGNQVLAFSGEEFSDPDSSYFFEKHDVAADARQKTFLRKRLHGTRQFAADLNGRFQGLLVDRSAGTATLFNDRYGLHRVYYHETPDAFYFAAEAKSILAVKPELRAIDPRGLGELVSNGCVLENRSVFRGIGVLPPASLWSFRQGAINAKDSYFNPKEWEEQDPLDLESYYQQIRAIFSRNIPRYFGGDQRVAVSLTGGLDSRMIMAWLRAPEGAVPCFSFGGMYRDCRDVTVARRVAKVCGQPHEVIPLGDEYLSQFAHYSSRTVYLSDGCVDVSHSPDLYINELARRIAPVRMTGNYGGEVLRSIRAFKPVAPPDGLFTSDFLTSIGQARQTYGGLIDVHPLTFSAFRQAPWHHYGLLSLEETQLALRSPYLDNEFVKTVFRAPKSTLSSNDISIRLIRDGNAALSRIYTDRGLAGNMGPALSAAYRNFLEFTFKAEYAYDYGMPQWVARTDNAFRALHLERLFLGRHKFYHFRIWYRDQLAKVVQDILLDPRALSRPYVNRKGLEAIVAGHVSGNRNYTTAIHRMLTLEHLHRNFIDAS
jgi:asparagine synthase (glutamine-hydrolysing)